MSAEIKKSEELRNFCVSEAQVKIETKDFFDLKINDKTLKIEFSKENVIGIEDSLKKFLICFKEYLVTQKNMESVIQIIDFFLEKYNSRTVLEGCILTLRAIAKYQSDASLHAAWLIGSCCYYGYIVVRNTQSALSIFQSCCEQDHAWAQYAYGCSLYFTNRIGKKNYRSAFKLFQKSANQGFGPALFFLGFCYEKGKGVEIDKKRAIELYEQSMIKKYPLALYHLALYYEKGKIVEKNKKKAIELFQQAATQCRSVCLLKEAIELYQQDQDDDYSLSQYYLGYCYQKGIDVEIDLEKANVHYQKAAEYGLAEAQYRLGKSYEIGRGVGINLQYAVELYTLAAAQGLKEAKFRLNAIKNERLSESKLRNKPVATASNASEFKPKRGRQIINWFVSTASGIWNFMTHRCLKRKKEAISVFTKEQKEYIESLKASGLTSQEILKIKKQFEENKFLRKEVEVFSEKLNQIDIETAEINKILMRDPEAQKELNYIESHEKLNNYFNRFRKELIIFVGGYFSATSGILKLGDNKKDDVMSAIALIPGVGLVLKGFLALGSSVNKRHKLFRMNRLNELFNSSEHITRVCSIFARKLTIAKEKIIEKQKIEKYEGSSKLKSAYYWVKKMPFRIKRALFEPGKIGLTYKEGDQLAILDVGYFLEKILSGKIKINEKENLENQFIKIMLKKYNKNELSIDLEISTKSQMESKVSQENNDHVEALLNQKQQSKKQKEQDELLRRQEIEEMRKEFVEKLKKNQEEIENLRRNDEEIRREINQSKRPKTMGGTQAIVFEDNSSNGVGELREMVKQHQMQIRRLALGQEIVESRLGIELPKDLCEETEEQKKVQRELFG